MDWANRGPNLWEVQLTTVALAQGQTSFTLTPQEIMITNCARSQTLGGIVTDTMMSPISRADYLSISQKTTQGTPSQFYLERTITPTVYIYQPPSDGTYSIKYYRMFRQQDVGTMQQVPDFPNRWWRTAVTALAVDLAAKFGTTGNPADRSIDPIRLTLLQSQANSAFQAATTEDTEAVPVRLVPDVVGRRY